MAEVSKQAVDIAPVEIAPGVFQLDLNFQGEPGVIAAYLFADRPDATLIETGPTSTVETLLAGVRAAGVEPERITQLVVTHIHLDHAGASGSLLRRLPRARLFVHPAGAKHMIDPSKLMASASRIYGDRMDALWGEMVPVPADRLVVLQDGDTVRTGRRTLTALATPGHARHHHAYHEPEGALVFTGDMAGVRLGGSSLIRPPTPPPDIDLDAWLASVARLRALRPRRLYLTHFGGYAEPEAHFDRLIAQLFDWAGWTEAQLEREPDTTKVAAALARKGDAEITAAGVEPLTRAYELASPYQMGVDGYARWLQKRNQGGAS
ncbi:MAG TPA: MBL fold metallo-hydrolase [Gemmatimonadales bacterium]|nr:MBL fold metallo-hydrolase [Gemmatimonadales bacterium]